MKIVRLFIIPMLLAAALADDARVTELIKRSDTEIARHHTAAALGALRAAEAIEPQTAEALVQISKQYTEVAAATVKDPNQSRAILEQALACAQRALSLDPRNAKAHLSVAICYGKLTDFVGNRTKLEYSKLIRDEAQRSIALDPRDDFGWHVLGRWHAGIADVGVVMKALAKAVYGGLPEASNEEAARCLEKAAKLAPRRIIHHAELAKVYQALGKKDAAKKEWRTVLSLPAVDEEDRNYQREAKARIGE
ncbi:MAG: hypothetical protein ABI680_18330, partial [Chthoniobacteraceae bacterium]